MHCSPDSESGHISKYLLELAAKVNARLNGSSLCLEDAYKNAVRVALAQLAVGRRNTQTLADVYLASEERNVVAEVGG